jgi:hypothetical protein
MFLGDCYLIYFYSLTLFLLLSDPVDSCCKVKLSNLEIGLFEVFWKAKKRRILEKTVLFAFIEMVE